MPVKAGMIKSRIINMEVERVLFQKLVIFLNWFGKDLKKLVLAMLEGMLLLAIIQQEI